MNLKRKYLLPFILIGFIQNGYNQDNKELLKLSIGEAKDYALKNNRSVQASKIDINIADKKVWETIATGLPQINFTTNYQHQFSIPQLSFGSYFDVNSLPDGYVTKSDIQNAYKPSPMVSLGVPNNVTFDATVSQLIFSGEYLVGLQAVKVLKQVSEKALVRTEDITKESVSTTYYLILVLQENIRVLNNSLKYTSQTYEEMVKMNQQGFNEETDVDQMKISMSSIETLKRSSESQEGVAMKLLKYQLGLNFDQKIVLTDSLPGIIEEGNMLYLSSPAFDVKSNIDYQIVSNQKEISALMLKREKSKLLPTISSFYRHEDMTNKPQFNFLVKDVLGVNLSLPIATSGQRLSRINQAKLDLQKSNLNLDDTEQALIMQYETSKSDYETAFSNYATNKESMQLSKKVYDRTLIKYQEGVTTSFELTQKISQFLTAETKYYYSILSLLNAKAKLDRILGIN